MPTALVIELDQPVAAVGKFLGYVRAFAPAILPRLKDALPELIRNHVPMLAPLMALESGLDLGAFIERLLARRLGYLDVPESILAAAVACLEAHAAPPA